MPRGIITISETGAVTMPDVPVWMTLPEIVDLLGVFECDIRRTINSIYKNKELDELDTMKYVRQPDGISFDAYNLEVVMAVSFRIQSNGSRIFRQYVMRRLCSCKDSTTPSPLYLIVHGEVFNRKGWDGGDMYN